jgi:hypothetical protein
MNRVRDCDGELEEEKKEEWTQELEQYVDEDFLTSCSCMRVRVCRYEKVNRANVSRNC